jgi:hypothetical protein
MPWPWKSKTSASPKPEPRPPAVNFRELERQAERADEAAWERRVTEGDAVESWLRRKGRLWWW